MTVFLCIATNNYNRFLPALHQSITEHLPGVDLICFVNEYNPELKARQIFIEHPQFPGATLGRFEIYLRHRALWANYDHVYHIDADMLVTGKFSTEWPLVAVPHWGHYETKDGPFCDDHNSSAFVFKSKRETYYTAQFYGGRSAEFESLLIRCLHKYQEDKKNGIKVQWHDETYLNCVLSYSPPIQLKPGFIMPEGEEPNDYTKMTALVKDNKVMQL